MDWELAANNLGLRKNTARLIVNASDHDEHYLVLVGKARTIRKDILRATGLVK